MPPLGGASHWTVGSAAGDGGNVAAGWIDCGMDGADAMTAGADVDCDSSIPRGAALAAVWGRPVTL